MNLISLLDVRFAARQLLKHPGFTLVSVLTLALGIGANTAIFSLVEGVLLRPLDYREPERLVRIFDAQLARPGSRIPVAYPNYLDWKAQSTRFEDMAAQHYSGYNLTGRGEPRRLNAMRVTAGLFPLLGVRPALGRLFHPEDEVVGQHRRVLVSHEFWQRDLAGDPGIVGQFLELDAERFEIVGVMPAGFRHPSGLFEVWTPAAVDDEGRQQRGSHSWQVIGRLKPGVTVEEARAELEVIAARLASKYEENRGFGVALAGLQEEMVGGTRRSLLVLLGAVVCVLLIACANVANLLLARTATRQREFAVRAALGAGRARLASQLMVEHVLLALMGGGLGVLLAAWGVSAFVAWAPADLPRLHEVRVNLTVLGFSFLVSVATGLIFGLVPVAQAMKTDVNEALKDAVRGSTEGARRHRARSVLVVTEVALSLVLLAGAGLLLRSFIKIHGLNPGFQPEGVLTADLAVPEMKYPSSERQAAMIQQVLAQLQATPGVTSASAVFGVPLGRMMSQSRFILEGQEARRPDERDDAAYRQVAPGYFRTLQIPMVAGRDFDAGDTTNAVRVAVVNQAFVRAFMPGVTDQSALGRRLHRGDDFKDGWVTIVGVTADVRNRDFADGPKPEFYFPITQECWGFVTLVVRTPGVPGALAGALKQAVAAVDPTQPVDRVQPMDSMVSEHLSTRRLQAALLGGFSALALVLAGLGIYGVMAYSVSRRTQEIGIRMALGAQWRDVAVLVMRQGMRLAGVGMAIGLLAGLYLARFLSSLLYEVRPHDPPTFGLVTVVLAGVVVAACWIPARRAARVGPMEALRSE